MIRGEKNTCPFVAADQRLCDALIEWQDAKKHYFNPGAFRRSLNNCVQALRSVSWILQKSKSEFPGFPRWYQGWQDRMRADPVLKWLVDARNVIVKEGDLATHSKVRVAVVKSWFEPPSIEVEAPPFAKTESFARIVVKAAPEAFFSDAGLLRVERRWVDSELPSHELLEALAHAFGVLSELLFDAHKSLSLPEWPRVVPGMPGTLPPRADFPPACWHRYGIERFGWIYTREKDSCQPHMLTGRHKNISRKQPGAILVVRNGRES